MDGYERLRFHSKTIHGPGGCLLWTGAVSGSGYGRMWFRGKMESAHRLAYEDAAGPIPDGFQVDHLCSVRACVYWGHLEAVTPRENARRAGCIHLQDADECAHGHRLRSPDDLLSWKEHGKRRFSCKRCRYDRNNLRRRTRNAERRERLANAV